MTTRSIAPQLSKRSRKKSATSFLDAHGGKDDGEVRAIGHAGLTDDLDGQLVVLHAGAGEDGQLLAADQRGQAVDGRKCRCGCSYADTHG